MQPSRSCALGDVYPGSMEALLGELEVGDGRGGHAAGAGFVAWPRVRASPASSLLCAEVHCACLSQTTTAWPEWAHNGPRRACMLQGLWSAHYGAHGMEVLQLQWRRDAQATQATVRHVVPNLCLSMLRVL